MSAAFTKCFSQSNLRHITNGTTGLQKVTGSEFSSILQNESFFFLTVSSTVYLCFFIPQFLPSPLLRGASVGGHTDAHSGDRAVT